MLTPYTSNACFTMSCADGLDGVQVTECATSTSIISQADADKKAATAARLRAYAALQCSLPPGPTPTIYYNLPLSGDRHCTRCSGPYTVHVEIAAAAFYSLVSQAAVDAAAAAALARETDAGQCPDSQFYNVETSATAYCPITADGDPFTATVAAGAYCSDVSQEVADEMAQAAAQAAAASGVVCTFYNSRQTATASCPAAGEPSKPYGPVFEAIVDAKTYSSNVSFADANAIALAAAQAAALAGLTCYEFQNVEVTSLDPDCEAAFGPQYSGPAVAPVVIAAGNYFSNTSQGHADDQAQAAADAEYLTHLLCVYDPSPPP